MAAEDKNKGTPAARKPVFLFKVLAPYATSVSKDKRDHSPAPAIRRMSPLTKIYEW